MSAMEEQIATTTPHLVEVLQDFRLGDTNIKKGQRLHGIWMLDGFFYFPQTVGENTFIVSVAGQNDVESIGDENERDSE